MASLSKAINKQFFDSVLPVYGTPRKAMPSYDASQRAFICNQYTSGKGHTYFTALRFSDRIAIAEKVALAYNWTYLNGIEIYAFNGNKFELIQKKDFDTATYHSKDLVKNEAVEMLKRYFQSVKKTTGASVSDAQIEEEARNLVENSYKSLLDEDYNIRLTQILPALEK